MITPYNRLAGLDAKVLLNSLGHGTTAGLQPGQGTLAAAAFFAQKVIHVGVSNTNFTVLRYSDAVFRTAMCFELRHIPLLSLVSNRLSKSLLVQ